MNLRLLRYKHKAKIQVGNNHSKGEQYDMMESQAIGDATEFMQKDIDNGCIQKDSFYWYKIDLLYDGEIKDLDRVIECAKGNVKA